MKASALILALLVPSLLPAQSLSLDKFGGAAPGNTTLSLQGASGSPYVIIAALSEQPTTVAGVTFDIPLDALFLSTIMPGWIGTLGANGAGSATFALPSDPVVLAAVISFQAAAGTGPFAVSNLARLTPAAPGTFEDTLNPPPTPILGGGVATAADAGLLFCGGSGPVAQRYNSRTETWEMAGVTFGVGLLAQSTGLPDGRVLFTGGIGTDGQPTNAAAVYDPVAQTTTTLTMAHARAGHGASVMGNGKVLITGGFQNFTLSDPLAFLQGIQNTTEIYDPANDSFTAGPTLLEARALHTSSTLTNGQVLIAGGLSIIPIVNVPNVSATAYRFNPATNSFSLPILMNGARFLHSAVGLSNGKVLLVGGLTLDLTQFLTTLDPTTIVVGTRTDCQVFTTNLLSGSFATVNGLAEGRAGAGVAALPGGKALIAGGSNLTLNGSTSTFTNTTIATADVFTASGSSGTIAPTGSMSGARFLPVLSPLPDGTVLVVGGGPASSEVYQP